MRNAILRISSAVSTATDAVITGGTSRFPRTPSTGPLRGRALRASRALAVERDLGRPHRDRVAGAELCALHALAVHLHAVRRAALELLLGDIDVATAFVRLHHAGCDPELADVEVGVRLDLHARGGEQRV